jgi:hypothetical protein
MIRPQICALSKSYNVLLARANEACHTDDGRRSNQSQVAHVFVKHILGFATVKQARETHAIQL